MTCLTLVIKQDKAEVSGDGNCAHLEDGLANTECATAMGSTSLLQKTADGLKTEMAWEEEGATRKSPKTILVSQKGTKTKDERPGRHRPKRGKRKRKARVKKPRRKTTKKRNRRNTRKRNKKRRRQRP